MINEKTYYPNSPLNQFVDVIWIGKASYLDIESNHYAPLFTELIFNYGDGFQVTGQNIENAINTYDHHIISGLKTTPFQTKVSGVYNSVGLILKPFCYGMLINSFGTRVMDQISEILYEALLSHESPKFEDVEQHLLKLFGTSQLDSDLIKFEQYINTNFLKKGSLKAFNLSIPISQKSFIQKFKKYYALTPGEYIKLRKVNVAIATLQRKQNNKLVEVGLDSGFYDQSHFIKTFKKFCGYTPKEFLISTPR